MAYRATPLGKTADGKEHPPRIPTSPSNLNPLGHTLSRERCLSERETEERPRKALPYLLPVERVWLQDKEVEETVVGIAGPLRSYTVVTPKGQLRRN